MQRTHVGALLGALAFFASSAHAEGIVVHPVRMEMATGERSTSLTVTNDTRQPKVMQASLMRWRQVNGESVYEPARDMLATPLLFRMAPTGSQLLRIGFAGQAPPTDTEQTYRLFLDEVPEAKKEQPQLSFRLRLGMPLFIAPQQPRDAMDWQFRRLSNGRVSIRAENKGNRHVRLSSLSLVDDAQRTVSEQTELVYLLAGSAHEWQLTPNRPLSEGENLQLRAESGRGALQVKLRLSSH